MVLLFLGAVLFVEFFDDIIPIRRRSASASSAFHHCLLRLSVRLSFCLWLLGFFRFHFFMLFVVIVLAIYWLIIRLLLHLFYFFFLLPVFLRLFLL